MRTKDYEVSTYKNSFIINKLIGSFWPYLVLLIFLHIETSLWFKGRIIYWGDQSFIIYPGVNKETYFWDYQIPPYAISYYPFPSVVNLGTYNIFISIIIYIFEYFPFTFGEQLLTFLVYFIGDLFIYKVVYSILEERFTLSSTLNKILGISSAIFYSVNWNSFMGYVGESLLTSFFFFPLLPMIIYFLKKLKIASSKKAIAKNFLFALLLSLVLISTGGPIYLIQDIGIPLIFGIVYIFSNSFLNIKNKLKLTALFVISLLSSILYWSVFLYHGASQTISSKGLIESSYQYFVANSLIRPFNEIVRGLWFPAYPYSSPPLYIEYSSIFVSILLFLLIIFIRKDKELLAWELFAFLAITLASGVTTPFRPIYVWLFFHIPYLADFRTEYVAFPPYLSLFYSVIVWITIRYILDIFKRRRIYVYSLFILFFIILNIIYPFPIVSGNVFQPYNDKTFVGLISIPKSFIETVNYINNYPGDFNVLLLPPALTEPTTKWYDGTDLFKFFINHPTLSSFDYGSSNPTVRGLYFAFNYAIYYLNRTNITFIYNFLFLFNIKFIIVQTDFIGNSPISPLNISQYISNLYKLQGYGIVTFVKKLGYYYIFKVNINSSYVFVTNRLLNISNISVLERYNISNFLIPWNSYKFMNPVVVKVFNISNYKYIIFTYSYDKGITFNGEYALQYSFANLYYNINNSNSGVIYVTYQNILNESYFILIAYILAIIAEAIIIERTKLINIRGYNK